MPHNFGAKDKNEEINSIGYTDCYETRNQCLYDRIRDHQNDSLNDLSVFKIDSIGDI